MNPVPDHTSETAGPLSKLSREPLFHFLGLAALLFVANAVFSGDDREVITVDAATQEYLVEQRQNLVLRELTEQEKSETVETFIDEEILVREARKRGFENSSRIRTLLIQNMRFFMSSEIPEPSEEELRAFYEDNIDSFESPAMVTYDHVLFNDPDGVPPDTLDLLRAGAEPVGMGDTNAMNSRIYRAAEQSIVANFGREQAPRILAIEDGEWHGPFNSESGVHFLRVAQRYPSQRPDWESARNWIGTEWLRVRNREVVDRQMSTLRENYRIEVETAGEAGE